MTIQSHIFNRFGGVDILSNPFDLDPSTSKKPMASFDANNIDLFNRGSLAKRKGKTRQGQPVSGGSWASQTVGSTTISFQVNSGSIGGYFQKITASSTTTISSLTLQIGFLRTFTNVTGVIYSNNAGSPGTVITNGTSTVLTDSSSFGATPQTVTFTFPIPPSVTNTTVYWFGVIATAPTGGSSPPTIYAACTAGSNVKHNANIGVSSYVADSNELYYVIQEYKAMQGLYDLRTGTSTITQNIMSVVGGAIYYAAAVPLVPATAWTSLKSGLGSGQNVLYDFATLKNYMFSCDYGNSQNQAWDASSTSTMPQGYRLSVGYVASGTPKSATISSISGAVLTMAATQNGSGIAIGKLLTLSGGATSATEQIAVQSFTYVASAGSINLGTITLASAPQSDRTTAKWNGVSVATDTSGSLSVTVSGTPVTTDTNSVKIIGVTQLKSGGYRCTEEIGVAFAATTATGRILITNVAMNSSTDGTQNAFDINTSATKWFMTKLFAPGPTSSDPTGLPAAQTYYKIPTTMLSTALNPMANSVTAFNITNVVAGTENTLLQEFGLDQSYFTSQVDAPKAKFLKVYDNFLTMAGDPLNPSRLWISELYSPQNWSTFGGINGSYLDIDVNGGDIITGLYKWNSYLFVFKTHSIFRINYTGNASLPFTVDRLNSTLGALSHFCIQETDKGMVFISEQGMALCNGASASIIGQEVSPYFDPNYASKFNLSSMIYATSMNNTGRKQIWFGVSTTSATVRDKVLIYDYVNEAFWLNDGVSANYFKNVADSNGFSQVWSGDYSAQVFQHESGTNDNGSAISFSYLTPYIFDREQISVTQTRKLFISGVVQSSGNLYVDVFIDLSTTASQTLTYDMTAADFALGQFQTLSGITRAVQFKLRSSDLDVPVTIYSVRYDSESLGVRRG